MIVVLRSVAASVVARGFAYSGVPIEPAGSSRSASGRRRRRPSRAGLGLATLSNFEQIGRRDDATTRMAKVENDQRPGAKTGARRFDPAAFLATAAKGRAISTHQKGESSLRKGDATDAIFYIKKGKVKVTVVSKQGKEAVVALLSADEFFGEGCLIGQPKRLATATAMTDCVTMRVETMEMHRVLDRQPAFSQMFVSHILTRSARVEEDLVDQLFNSTEKRLARLLLLLANLARKGGRSPWSQRLVRRYSPR